MKTVVRYWFVVLIGLFFLFAAGVYIVFGEGSYIAVHDNLDLFAPQYQMMKDTGTFWGRNAEIPFLGGVSRDVLPAEFSLQTILYMVMPAFPAYIAGYLLKILIALISCYLLAREVFRDDYRDSIPLIFMVGFAYGLLNMFPNFGISFASIPLVVFLLLRIYRTETAGKVVQWYCALFFYPVLSYFSYFGLFILAYLLAAIIWTGIKNKKIPWRLFLALVVLAAGFVACEYRLFGQMLFSEVATIRMTIKEGSLTFGGIVKEIITVWSQSIFHAESVHTWFVLPVCGIYFFILNGSYIYKKDYKGVIRDRYNLLALVLIFNSVIYGIYYSKEFRDMVELLCPPLTGWQFNRTVFFNPFVWYASFFMVLKRMYECKWKGFRSTANVMAMVSVLVILLTGSRYNDLYHTCYNKVREWATGKISDQLSYEEFFSVSLFEAAKESIGYQGEWSAAYGFYPAVLEYNGIATLDGYLGFYAQEYKEAFREVIAPALLRIPESKAYYDDWGARVGLFSGSYPSVTNSQKQPQVAEDLLYINTEAFYALQGRYIFSRIPLINADESGVRLILAMQGEKFESPYDLFIYAVQSELP